MLKEIQILRPLLIIGVIIGHCFCVYNSDNGSWPNILGIEQIHIYKFLNPLFISLGTFVMIMGYLFAHNNEKYVKLGNWLFIKKKFLRLYIPSMFFSFIYAVLFVWKIPDDITYNNISKVLVLGVGHLWFLPMTFFNYCILKTTQPLIDRYPKLFLIASVAVMPLLSWVPDQIFVYLPFIILGYLIYGHTKILEKYAYLLLIIWVLIFIGRCALMELPIITLPNFLLRFSTNICSALAFWGLSMHFSKKIQDKSKLMLFNNLNKSAFGAYLLQEFIIRFLIYQIPLFSYVGSLFLPWVTALIAIPLSFGLSNVLQRTKFGAYLLG